MKPMKIISPDIPRELRTVPNLQHLLRTDERLAGLLLQDQEAPTLRAKGVSLTESRVHRCTFLQAKIEKLQLQDCALEHSDFSGSNLADTSWHSVAVASTRCSGMQLPNSLLKNVTFTGCRLDLANFRFAKLENVRFEQCVVSGMDFYNAQLKHVAFVDCDVEGVEFSGAKLTDVDLTESRLLSVKGLSGLKGARITSEQLVSLLPYLAQEIGLIVE